MTERTITIPAGYKAILVPDEFDAPHPDFDECVRQANLATGIDTMPSSWLNIFIREVNRWCYQAYGNVFTQDKWYVYKEGEKGYFIDNDDEASKLLQMGWTIERIPETNPTLGRMFDKWANGNETLTAKEGFIGALAIFAATGKLHNGANLDVIRRSHNFTIDNEGKILGLTSGDFVFEDTGIKLDSETIQAMKDDDALAEFFAKQIRDYPGDDDTDDRFFTVAIQHAGAAPDVRSFIQHMIDKHS